MKVNYLGFVWYNFLSKVYLSRIFGNRAFKIEFLPKKIFIV